MRANTSNTIEGKIAHLLRIEKTYAFICQTLQTSPKRVSRVSKSLKDLNQVPPPLKIGQPTKVSNDITDFIRNNTEEEPRMSSENLSKKILEEFNVSLCSSLVSITRRKIGYVFTHPRKRQAFNQNQIAKRIQFCEKQIENAEKWRHNIIITDESRFGMYPDSSRLWLRRGNYNEKTFVSTEKFYPTIMVWAGIGYNYKSQLIILERTLNAESYIQMLEDNHIIEDIKTKNPGQIMWFQQDGAPAHNSKKTKKYITKLIHLVDDWPANSPDLSVIENLWAIIKQRIKINPPRTLEELKNRLIEEWNKLDQNLINNLIMEYPDRFRLCIREKGKSIARILHKIKEYNNEHVPTKEEIESIGIITPLEINETFVNNEIIIAGIILSIQKSALISTYYETKMIDHQNHLNDELPRKVTLMIPEEFIVKFTSGNYCCVSGKFISVHDFVMAYSEEAENIIIENMKKEFIIDVSGVD